MNAPSLDHTAEAWRDAELEREYWEAHHDEFVRRYPDQFVAVRDGRVIATAQDLSELDAELKCAGLGAGQVWVHFFATARQIAL